MPFDGKLGPFSQPDPYLVTSDWLRRVSVPTCTSTGTFTGTDLAGAAEHTLKAKAFSSITPYLQARYPRRLHVLSTMQRAK
jgi:hypothetical protein